jgi:hypothetical protein
MQFLISGGDKRNKGDYFASLIAKVITILFIIFHLSFLHLLFPWTFCFDLQYQAEAFGYSSYDTTYLPRNSEMHGKRYPHEDYDYMAPR